MLAVTVVLFGSLALVMLRPADQRIVLDTWQEYADEVLCAEEEPISSEDLHRVQPPPGFEALHQAYTDHFTGQGSREALVEADSALDAEMRQQIADYCAPRRG